MRKIHRTLILPAACMLIGASMLTTTAYSDGPSSALFPPGPPEPTMKRLDQIDPRRCISQIPYVIEEPGSYQLCESLDGVEGEHGIVIRASNVTLDLSGNTLRGVSGTGDGIVVDALAENVVVKNGVIIDWERGIHLPPADDPGAEYSPEVCGLFWAENLQLNYNDRGMEIGRASTSSTVGSSAMWNLSHGIVVNHDDSSLPTQLDLSETRISANEGDGVHVTGNGGGRIAISLRNSAIHDNEGNGFTFVWSGGDASTKALVDFQSSRCDNNNGAGASIAYTGSDGHMQLRVRDSSFDNNGQVGLHLADGGSTGGSWGVSLDGFSTSRNTSHGLAFLANTGGGGTKAASIFIEFEGIKGESSSNGGDGIHKDWIDLPSFDWGLSGSRANNNGGNGVTHRSPPASDGSLDFRFNKFLRNGGSGIDVEGAKNVKLHEVDSSENMGNGYKIWVVGSDDVHIVEWSTIRITESKTHRNGSHGYDLRDYKIINIDKSSSGLNDGHGIYFRWDNQEVDNKAGECESKSVTISETVTTDNNGAGIRMEMCPCISPPVSVDIRRCRMRGNSGSGVSVEGNDSPLNGTISDNVISKNGDAGIETQSNSTEGSVCKCNNSIHGNGHGTRCMAPGVRVAHNTFADNEFSDVLINVPGTIVHNNSFRGSPTHVEAEAGTGDGVADLVPMSGATNPFANIVH